MPSYRVIWSIELHADSPLHAAQLARAIQLNPDSTATVFDVIPSDADVETIDLDEYCGGCDAWHRPLRG